MKMATGFTAVGLGSRTSLSKPIQDKLNNVLSHNNCSKIIERFLSSGNVGNAILLTIRPTVATRDVVENENQIVRQNSDVLYVPYPNK
jgi:hypothetical protein